MSLIQLPTPQLFDPNNAGDPAYRPDLSLVLRQALEWKEEYRIPSAVRDAIRICMLLIDGQGDFCFKWPFGKLYVGGRSGNGAIDDNRRLAQFVYRYLMRITKIYGTFDLHNLFQIFLPEAWLSKLGNFPNPHQTITTEMVDGSNPEFRPNPILADLFCDGDHRWLEGYGRHYVSQLDVVGKDPLQIWPHHCMDQTAGQAMVGILHEMIAFHAYARGIHLSDAFVKKGQPWFSEFYSPFTPEVTTDHLGKVLIEPNYEFLDHVLTYDAILVTGQAASNCVRAGLYDMRNRIRQINPSLMGKIYILEDCMSSVAVPNPAGGYYLDLTDRAQASLDEFATDGMHVVRSTTPMDEWPNFPIA